MKRSPGWYPGPGLTGRPWTAGSVLRWWDGAGWGPDVAVRGMVPTDPPLARRYAPGSVSTTVLQSLPETTAMPLG